MANTLAQSQLGAGDAMEVSTANLPVFTGGGASAAVAAPKKREPTLKPVVDPMQWRPLNKPRCYYGQWCWLSTAANGLSKYLPEQRDHITAIKQHYRDYAHPIIHPSVAARGSKYAPVGQTPVYPADQDNNIVPLTQREQRAYIAKEVGVIRLVDAIPEEKRTKQWVISKVKDTVSVVRPDFYDVVHVDAITNHVQRDAFVKTKKELEAAGYDTTEEWLFHGATSREGVDNIAKMHFLSPAAENDGYYLFAQDSGWFGRGIYLAFNSDYSAQYTKYSTEDIRWMFLMTTLRGRCYRMRESMHGMDIPSGYHSIISPCGLELCVRETRFILPRFVVGFKKPDYIKFGCENEPDKPDHGAVAKVKVIE